MLVVLGEEEHQGLLHGQWTLAKSRPVGGERCEGSRLGSRKKVLNDPITVRCPLNLMRMGGGLCHLQKRAAIYSCSLKSTICSALGHHWWQRLVFLESWIYFITTCCYWIVRVFTPRRVIFYTALPPAHRDMYLLCPYTSSRVETTAAQEAAVFRWLESDTDSNSYPVTYKVYNLGMAYYSESIKTGNPHLQTGHNNRTYTHKVAIRIQ